MGNLKVKDEILLQVEKPARYIGNEINSIKKDINNIDIRFAFCFPDVYEVGMSYLGMQILYYFLNNRKDTYCERVFAPWIDMEKKMREEKIPLFALESQDDVKKFDFLGFTLQYEMCYTNIINIIDLAGIPIRNEDRGENDPIICAGGPCSYNPEPLAPFVDFFYIGEGEASLGKVLDIYKEHKKQGGTRREFLEKLLDVEGIYVPCFYDVNYKEDGTIESFVPNHKKAKPVIRKQIVKDLENTFYPSKVIIPWIQTVHDRASLEVFRGCIRGCRFCSAGMIYRPVREKSKETLLKQAKMILENTGYEEISLSSLSTSDYSQLEDFSNQLLDVCREGKVNISLPSLRIDKFSLDLMSKVQEIRKSSLTFAPEAGTQRLRDVINKGITEENILKGCKMAFEGGWDRVKLYFMIGLPTETTKDLDGIVDLANDIVNIFYNVKKNKKNRGVKVVIGSSCFVPKPFTPFQWEPQDTYKDFMDKQYYIKKKIKRKQIQYNYHDAMVSSLEGMISRGDRRVGEVIYCAWKNGARFDGWSEHFNMEYWEKAFKETGIDPWFYANRRRNYDEILPWDHIDIGVKKSFLKQEHQKALKAEITFNCRQKCNNCGAKSFNGGICYEG
ncbi:TIGR03960 family B12-binding radical SAM protein [Defluviitalea phaphyphila]|uniref:TIGR03960 family B12-binding radical SAM protein n=1 Tax=Defluviitalea phaphyphila TaxID=1473580 RepID=UPI000730AF4C|nr:TIGR03960 family B12-binding radical SAM protein [Defluviitalea phaphyphila]